MLGNMLKHVATHIKQTIGRHTRQACTVGATAGETASRSKSAASAARTAATPPLARGLRLAAAPPGAGSGRRWRDRPRLVSLSGSSAGLVLGGAAGCSSGSDGKPGAAGWPVTKPLRRENTCSGLTVSAPRRPAQALKVINSDQ